MTRETEPITNLEVVVPRIIIPAPSPASPGTALNGDRLPEQQEEVQLLTFPVSTRHALSTSERTISRGEATTYANRQGPFHVFRVKNILTQGQAHLVQILRRFAGRNLHPTGGQDLMRVLPTAEFLFTVQYQRGVPDPLTTESQVMLIPGLQRVVVTLDDDNVPKSYSVDGAES